MRLLTPRRVLDAGGLVVDDVTCTSPRCGWAAPEHTAFYAIVLVRRGVFRRRVEGRETLFDPTLAYAVAPGREQQIAHPVGGGDQATRIILEPEIAAALWGGDPTLPGEPLSTTPALDLRHRVLVARAPHEEDDTLVEATLALLATLLEQADPARCASGRPSTRHARRRLVADARQALTADPRLRLIDLARCVGASPHHLSRIFHDHTGDTSSRYRRRLRARIALDRLAGGETNLARIAADAGFADHAHLTRTLKVEYGRPPRELRHLFSPSQSPNPLTAPPSP